jgi:hypothetical protein
MKKKIKMKSLNPTPGGTMEHFGIQGLEIHGPKRGRETSTSDP